MAKKVYISAREFEDILSGCDIAGQMNEDEGGYARLKRHLSQISVASGGVIVVTPGKAVGATKSKNGGKLLMPRRRLG